MSRRDPRASKESSTRSFLDRANIFSRYTLSDFKNPVQGVRKFLDIGSSGRQSQKWQEEDNAHSDPHFDRLDYNPRQPSYPSETYAGPSGREPGEDFRGPIPQDCVYQRPGGQPFASSDRRSRSSYGGEQPYHREYPQVSDRRRPFDTRIGASGISDNYQLYFDGRLITGVAYDEEGRLPCKSCTQETGMRLVSGAEFETNGTVYVPLCDTCFAFVTEQARSEFRGSQGTRRPLSGA